MHVVRTYDSEVRRSAKIATVAELMECTVSDIYKLIRRGELEAHGKGIRGVRIFLDSVAAYQQRHTKKPRDKLVPMKSRASGAAHNEAVAGLKAKGLL